jgi:hypothetical protein
VRDHLRDQMINGSQYEQAIPSEERKDIRQQTGGSFTNIQARANRGREPLPTIYANISAASVSDYYTSVA